MQTSEMYILNDVVKLTGIPKQTLHAWERRYRAVVPQRQESNRRVYSRGRSVSMRLLKELSMAASVSAILRIWIHLVLKRSWQRAGEQDVLSTSELLDIIEAFDQEALDRKLTDFFLARGPIALVQDMVLPTLREIGDRWEKNSLSTIAEHLFSASARNLLGLALNQGPRPSSGVVRNVHDTRGRTA